MPPGSIGAVCKGRHPGLQRTILLVACKRAALQQGVRHEELQFGFDEEIKLGPAAAVITSRAGELTEQPLKVGIHFAEGDQRIERCAVLHRSGEQLAAADNLDMGADGGELLFRGDIYIYQQIGRKLVAPAHGLVIIFEPMDQRLGLPVQCRGAHDTDHQLALKIVLFFGVIGVAGMRGDQRAGPGIVVGLIVGIGDIVRGIHDLHGSPAVDIDAAVAGRRHPPVQEKLRGMCGFVKVIYSRPVGIGVVRAVEPDIDKIVVFVEPDHMGDGIACLRRGGPGDAKQE